MKISILGTVGIPASYGGFETLAENLARYHLNNNLPNQLIVYCSTKGSHALQTCFGAELRYIPLGANGVSSIFYDIVSLFSAVWNRNDVILLLGVSGAIALPLVRFFSSVRVITNIDGIEWQRDKWRGFAKHFLRFSEKMAVYFSHEVISDNSAIADYVKRTYEVDSHVIAYGGDQAIAVDAAAVDEYKLPESFAFSVCRIEPENNVHVILDAFSKLAAHTLVIVGNWNNSQYSCKLRERYSSCNNLYLLDSIYDLGKLKSLRLRASFYVHGHSAGGTNPSLVEAMHFGKAVLAFDCDYNRRTTEDRALFFKDGEDLQHLIKSLDKTAFEKVGQDLIDIANRRYTWHIIAGQYFALIDKTCHGQS